MWDCRLRLQPSLITGRTWLEVSMKLSSRIYLVGVKEINLACSLQRPSVTGHCGQWAIFIPTICLFEMKFARHYCTINFHNFLIKLLLHCRLYSSSKWTWRRLFSWRDCYCYANVMTKHSSVMKLVRCDLRGKPSVRELRTFHIATSTYIICYIAMTDMLEDLTQQRCK